MNKYEQDAAAQQRMEGFLFACEQPQMATFNVAMWNLHVVRRKDWQKYAKALAKHVKLPAGEG
jgi:hypothetical protein